MALDAVLLRSQRNFASFSHCLTAPNRQEIHSGPRHCGPFFFVSPVNSPDFENFGAGRCPALVRRRLFRNSVFGQLQYSFSGLYVRATIDLDGFQQAEFDELLDRIHPDAERLLRALFRLQRKLGIKILGSPADAASLSLALRGGRHQKIKRGSDTPAIRHIAIRRAEFYQPEGAEQPRFSILLARTRLTAPYPVGVSSLLSRFQKPHQSNPT